MAAQSSICRCPGSSKQLRRAAFSDLAWYVSIEMHVGCCNAELEVQLGPPGGPGTRPMGPSPRPLPKAPLALRPALPDLQKTYHARLLVAEVGFPNLFLLGAVLVSDGGAPKTRWPRRSLYTRHAALAV